MSATIKLGIVGSPRDPISILIVAHLSSRSTRHSMSEGGKEAIRADDEVVAKAEVLALKRQIHELQRVLGKKTLENEILREAVKVAHEKKLISRLPLLPDEDIP